MLKPQHRRTITLQIKSCIFSGQPNVPMKILMLTEGFQQVNKKDNVTPATENTARIPNPE